jgi:magnesium transporter
MQVLSAPVDLDLLRDLRSRDEFFWLDLDDPSRDEVEEIGVILGLHPLAVEDTQEFCQRPKVDSYGDQILLVYFGATTPPGAEAPEAVEMHLHISSHFVLSVHRQPCVRFDDIRQMLPRRPPEDAHGLIYRVIDALTDSILDVLERVAGRVEAHETDVYGHPRAQARDEMARLRQSLGRLRRVLVIQRQVFERAVEALSGLPGLEEDYGPYYRDVGDHLWRAIDEIEAAREGLAETLATYTNEVQERLTIVATIFLPLTVITGFFGMNFSWLISHIGEAGTFWGLGVGGMVAAASGIYLWLVRSGLIQRGRPRRGR